MTDLEAYILASNQTCPDLEKDEIGVWSENKGYRVEQTYTLWDGSVGGRIYWSSRPNRNGTDFQGWMIKDIIDKSKANSYLEREYGYNQCVAVEVVERLSREWVKSLGEREH